MTTTDPYRLTTPADGTPEASSPAVTGGEVVRTLLWILVVVSAVANSAATYAEADTWVHLACGVVTLLGAGTLAVRHLRGRR
ncbi:hypothetical protein PV726_23110 [Streptomyces europaeiscabiei]|uniref:hypothetical protein n=1 Tax=Streptomyces europaeiscabiei TaxID=146819 RepID=UPI0029A4BE47|nr:hypothetical protein [Streptomyces europaeiscabiei]MDX3693183.1 hypothetical protein [Streptomyces europaeiscabiei]